MHYMNVWQGILRGKQLFLNLFATVAISSRLIISITVVTEKFAYGLSLVFSREIMAYAF